MRVIILKLDFDGGVTALTGAADIGQGSSTMVADRRRGDRLEVPARSRASSPATGP